MSSRVLQNLTVTEIEVLTAETRQAASRWKDLAIDRYREKFSSQRFAQGLDRATMKDLVDIAALVVASMKAVTGIELYSTQVYAGWLIAAGRVAEMQTGEGKTFACLMPACLMAFDGAGVHVACPNDYLATRDHDLLAPVYHSLGLSTASLTGDESIELKQRAYRSDVLYAAAHTFGFDFLRDQLSLHEWQQTSMTDRLLGSALGKDTNHERIQRTLNAVIVDEADHVLLDDAMSPMVLAASSHGQARDAGVHRRARVLSQSLEMGCDYFLDPGLGQVHLTKNGFDRVYADYSPELSDRMRRPWHDYVIAAIRAAMLFKVQQHYVVRGGDVQIVDHTTGRIYTDRNWSDGIHQAIEAKEGLAITEESDSLRKTTRQHFFGLYGWMGGMTGTAADCEKEFDRVYETPVQRVATRIATRRRVLTVAAFETQEEKHGAIAAEVQCCHKLNRAVLVGTLTIEESREISAVLETHALEHCVLNGVQDADEAEIISKAGHCGAITVATSLAGRGTDIKLDDRVRDAGGLHVIVSQHHRLARVDRQLIGRCARAGDPGTARFFVSPQDQLPRHHATWLRRLIQRQAASLPYTAIAGEVEHHTELAPCRLATHITDVQRVLQKQEARERQRAAAQQRDNDRWQLGTRDAADEAASYRPEAIYV